MMNSRFAQLPLLNPAIILHEAPARFNGAPAWTLHNPISNEFYRIEWAEFECLARLATHRTMDELIQAVNAETTLVIDESDVQDLLFFLDDKGLLDTSAGALTAPVPGDISMAEQRQNKVQKSLFKKMLHGYLFFTLPLVKPDGFLDKALPYIRPLLSRGFITIMLLNLMLALVMTLPRMDEFFGTFTQLFSAQGIGMALLVFGGLKIVHEMAHAFTAKKYGVSVPHMGVAFIVLYPVLYTETTASWQLSSRQKRLHIGFAGILAELCLAGMFLWMWHLSPAGSVTQSVAFTAVVISLLGSLAVNLNPLMRFDGYYMLCDALGYDNLQHRACAFARHRLRRFLFADQSSAPEALPPSSQRFLTYFGFALLVYRFFLFLGIAVLVYVLFPKPLGAFLMAVELLWFIVLPIWAELKIWIEKRHDYIKNGRTAVSIFVVIALLIWACVPWHRSVQLPAVIHAAEYAVLYPVTDAYIRDVAVTDRQHVKQGQILMNLVAPQLDKDIQKGSKEIEALEYYKRRLSTNFNADPARIGAIDQSINLAQQKLESLKTERDRLQVRAPFDGVIRDFNTTVQAGRYIRKDEFLMRIVKPEHVVVTAYVSEQDRQRLNVEGGAVFRPHHSAFVALGLDWQSMGETNVTDLPFLSLSSVYGGALPSYAASQRSGEQGVNLLQGIYSVHYTIENTLEASQAGMLDNVMTGYVQVEGQASSVLTEIIRRVSALFIREIGLN